MTRKLSIKELKSLIIGEAKKSGSKKSGFKPPVDTEKSANDAKEVDADGYANTLENPVDFKKALKIEEARLTQRLRKVRARLNRR